jgi:hypothetical protein
MTIFGLEPAAQIVVLQGLSTYTALASAWCFARPVLRGQTVSSSKSILSSISSSQTGVDELVKRATKVLEKRETDNHPLAKRDNNWGRFLLAVSLVLFTAAVILQIKTEPSFHSPNSTLGNKSVPK